MNDPSGRHVTQIEHGGESIYAESTGAGEVVVLCHGLGGNHAIWWRQINAFARHHRVITWDQRGFGNSTARSGRTGIDEAADDLVAVLDALDVERTHLVGQSMGAFVALRVALEHPERTASLVLSTTLAGADPRHTRALRAAVPKRPRRDEHPVVSAAFSVADPDLVVLYNLISSFGTKPPVEAMLESMAAQQFSDSELAALSLPVLFLAAADDVLCPPDVMRSAAARVPSSTTRVLANAAHSAYFECPDAWTTAVLEFIDSSPSASGDSSRQRRETHVH
ncbi:alpha/beta hydrolase [Mycobacterium sp. Aquia_216]|uniref:alpha/beta fold hydrolase n=1 Tax=Mycobacterium sp. Aquia_216 TaxID=2991729 RepID=UPI00227B6F33|nr:alpha/beta hydrolase [Mycobacterium sp. Aquia_216]WAJ44260.1 alpha/beta hydrolase [Mycobacterium sp. Aquia_216]